jgi:hypothetical protein
VVSGCALMFILRAQQSEVKVTIIKIKLYNFLRFHGKKLYFRKQCFTGFYFLFLIIKINNTLNLCIQFFELKNCNFKFIPKMNALECCVQVIDDGWRSLNNNNVVTILETRHSIYYRFILYLYIYMYMYMYVFIMYTII